MTRAMTGGGDRGGDGGGDRGSVGDRGGDKGGDRGVAVSPRRAGAVGCRARGGDRGGDRGCDKAVTAVSPCPRAGRWLQGLALGWRYHRGKIYLFSVQRQPWAAAEAACAVTHAHLASVTSVEEQVRLGTPPGTPQGRPLLSCPALSPPT